MFRTSVYLPEELIDKISSLALTRKITKQEAMRQMISNGLKIKKKELERKKKSYDNK